MSVLLALALAFFLPTLVHGQRFWATATSDGWQYAKWGMSADDVVAASNGEARLDVYGEPDKIENLFFATTTVWERRGVMANLIDNPTEKLASCALIPSHRSIE